MHRDAERLDFIGQHAALEQTHDLAAMAERELRTDQIDHRALEPAAIEVLDEMGNVHGPVPFAGISLMVTRNFPFAKVGIASTK